MKYLKWFLFLLAIGMLFLCLFKFGMWRASYIQADEKPTISHQQQIYVASLEWCESQGKIDIKVFDSNSQFSYGAFQWQLSSFMNYAKKYNILPKNATEKDALEIIYDYPTQLKLTHLVLKDGGKKNWYNCTKRLGKYPVAFSY